MCIPDVRLFWERETERERDLPRRYLQGLVIYFVLLNFKKWHLLREYQ